MIGSRGSEVLLNEEAGHLLRSKNASQDDGGTPSPHLWPLRKKERKKANSRYSQAWRQAWRLWTRPSSCTSLDACTCTRKTNNTKYLLSPRRVLSVLETLTQAITRVVDERIQSLQICTRMSSKEEPRWLYRTSSVALTSVCLELGPGRGGAHVLHKVVQLAPCQQEGEACRGSRRGLWRQRSELCRCVGQHGGIRQRTRVQRRRQVDLRCDQRWLRWRRVACRDRL